MNASRTPEQIEGDINDVRDRVDYTLDTLEQRLDAKRLFREGLDYVRNTQAVKYATNAAASARRTAREHPVPSAIAGASLLGLIVWGLSSGLRSRTKRQGMRRMSDTAADWLTHARRYLRESTAESTAESAATSAVTSAVTSMAESARRARQRTRDAAGRAWQGIEHAGSEARTVVRKHPMAASAVGLAVIAIATAAAVPALRHRISR